MNIKPPKGMKTVLMDNELIGYIEDHEDQAIVQKRAENLLQSKGLLKDIPKAQTMFAQAQSFGQAAMLIYKRDLANFPRNPYGIAPFIVNAAFSVEMYLKCLQQAHGEIKGTHVLTSLYKALPNKVKDKIKIVCSLNEDKHKVEKGLPFKDHLKIINNAFVEWRYWYEGKSEQFDIAQVIFILDILHDVAVRELGIKHNK
ncbi:hypothetical protein [Photobacterium kishitanii]|uniref:HEPN domain-containing protein n=1 Tax=Photobacterium kishitanii TaxID=318456 RepID=A0A2T3KJT4_9GAMM|nr:hypothetical protein [Photobacterium kishitanii]PSU99765.1 hypothetical protein C9J27_09060 [Photobacterium kishitanii]